LSGGQTQKKNESSVRERSRRTRTTGLCRSVGHTTPEKSKGLESVLIPILDPENRAHQNATFGGQGKPGIATHCGVEPRWVAKHPVTGCEQKKKKKKKKSFLREKREHRPPKKKQRGVPTRGGGGGTRGGGGGKFGRLKKSWAETEAVKRGPA